MAKKIHPTALIHEEAQIGEDVEIGAFSIIHKNVVISDRCKIESYCELGIESPLSNKSKLYISQDSIIRSQSVFYEGSKFGEKLTTGHKVTVRENTVAGKNLQIGTLSDLQGDCIIGDYVRFHSNVHIGKLSKIGSFVWIFPYVVLTNDPHPPSNTLKGVTVKDFAVIATMTTILPGVVVGENTLIGAHSLLKDDAEDGMLYMGSPAKKICPTKKIKLQDGSNNPAYPWNTHFFRGYPEEITSQWKKDN